MRSRLYGSAAAAALVAGGLIAGQIVLPASADHLPADKTGAAASTVEVMQTQIEEGFSETPQAELLSGRLRVSSPTDLLIRVSAECALWTNTTTAGNDDQESVARVEIWATLDGTIVPVGSGDTGSGTSIDPDEQAAAGRVVFCNRAQRMKTELFDEESNNEEDEIIRLYNRTRSAHSFEWVALNAGDYDDPANGVGIIDFKVFARLAAQVICDDDDQTNGCLVPDLETPQNPAAKAAVGKRIVVIEPTKFPHDATL